MGEFLLILFLTVIIVLIVIYIFFRFLIRHLWEKLVNFLGKENLMGIITAFAFRKQIIMYERYRIKSISGMTNLVLPQVMEDIPDFNVNMIYNTIESNLKKIFLNFQNKTYLKDEDLLLLEEVINSKVTELKESNINLKYEDVKFHQHALKKYEKKEGIATLTTSSTLEYYYRDGKTEEIDGIKRQTRYTCKFVYIFDYSKIKEKNKEKLFVLHCPNCGAPLDSFNNGKCRYCTSQVGDVLAKTWKMVFFKEDY